MVILLGVGENNRSFGNDFELLFVMANMDG